MVFLGIDWGKIFSVPFWLDVRPGELSPLFEKYFLAVLIVNYSCYGLSKLIVRQMMAKRSFIIAKLWQKIGSFCLTMAVSFSFIFFFRYEAIPILGGRFWVLVWLITGFIWLVYLIRYYFVDVKYKLADLAKRQQYEKYLVKVKKKK